MILESIEIVLMKISYQVEWSSLRIRILTSYKRIQSTKYNSFIFIVPSAEFLHSLNLQYAMRRVSAFEGLHYWSH